MWNGDRSILRQHMEQSEGKVLDSSSNAEQSQAEKDDEVPVEQNLMDPKLRRLFSNRLSAQRSRQKKMKYVEELEERAKFLQDLLVHLQPQQVYYQNQLHSLMIEEQTLLHETLTFCRRQRFPVFGLHMTWSTVFIKSSRGKADWDSCCGE
ncbi:hypothetical protein ACSQ67_011916 [Phaseolus vulgaris]